jgi:predicted dinucleotide-binding enzyme
VKAFNHLPAKLLALQPNNGHGRRVIFLSGDDTAAVTKVATLADQLGFAPVQLGRLAEGGTLVQARERAWGPLIFQDLVKVEG